MKIISILLLISILIKYSLEIIHDEAFMNFTEICRFLHYPSEEYDIVTKDGYILKMFRL